jgi:endonuclease YncB( thermonuclease family)
LPRRLIAVAAALAAIIVALAAGPVAAGRPIEASRPAAIVIIDGDTISLAGERIRLLDIDAPESFRSRCEAELELGLKAKQRLRQLVDVGPIRVERHGRDRYGRTLARVQAGGADVGAVLIAEGLALPYAPGHDAKLKRLRSWCGPAAEAR